jgi:hypothetical protein
MVDNGDPVTESEDHPLDTTDPPPSQAHGDLDLPCLTQSHERESQRDQPETWIKAMTVTSVVRV